MNDFQLYSMLQELDKIVSQYKEGEELGRAIKKTKEQISTQHYRVVVIGEFNRGKSSLINAMLGTRILPTDILPMTAAVTRVVYGAKQSIQICFKDGTSRECSVDELDRYATKFDEDKEKTAAQVKDIKVSYPSVFLKNHFELIDTPGLNEDEKMSDVTLGTIGEVDAAVVVLSIGSPLSMTEQDLVMDLLREKDIRHIVFVVNKLDQLRRETDKDKMILNIKNRISGELLGRAAADSSLDQLKVQRILKEPDVFGVSASQAMESFDYDDEDLLDKSRFPEFKTDLLALLTAAQGEDPKERAEAVISDVVKNFPLWREKELSEVCTEIENLEENAEKLKNYLGSGKNNLTESLEKMYAALKAQLHIEESGLGSEKTRLEEMVKTDFIQALGEVRDSTNTDQFIRGCINRAADETKRKINEKMDSLKQTALQIINDYAVEPFVLYRQNAQLPVEKFKMKYSGYEKSFPEFVWEVSPVPETDDLKGKNVMPWISDASSACLKSFEQKIFSWVRSIEELFEDQCSDDNALDGALGGMERSLKKLYTRKSEIEEDGSEYQKRIGEMAGAFFVQEANV